MDNYPMGYREPSIEEELYLETVFWYLEQGYSEEDAKRKALEEME